MWYCDVETENMLEDSEGLILSSSSSKIMENKSDTSNNESSRQHDENNQNVENCPQKKTQEHKPWSLSDFVMGKQIAKGSFGVLYSAKEKKQNVVIAMKILFKVEIERRELKHQVRREIEIHTHLKHQNILRMYGWFQDEKRIFMVLELAPKGDLLNALQAEPKKRFSEQLAASCLKQLTEAIKYIHMKKVIHRDVKLENLLLDKDNVLKLTDFGWAVHTPSCTSFSSCGVRGNMAPEMLLDKPYDYAVDLWAIGVVGFHMIRGIAPFFGRNHEELVKRITSVELVFPDVKYFSADARDLILKLIVFDPSKRITLDEIINHEWIVKNQ